MAVAGEARLLRASLRGDHDAFARIVRRYQSLVCAITYSGTGDVAASEDLAQETFLTAWKRLDSLREPGRLRAWLCTIARNLTADYLRRRQRDPVAGAVPVEQATGLESSAPTPAEQAGSKERERLVWEALHAIPETYRVPLVLYYREHQSVRRVAREMELSPSAVKKRLIRGRGMLRDKVAALVEDTLTTTAPGSTFAAAVLAGLGVTAAKKGAGAGSTILGLSLAKAAAVGILAVGVAVGAAVALRPDEPEPAAVPPAAVAAAIAPEPGPPAEPAVVYADHMPKGLLRIGWMDFPAYAAAGPAFEAATGGTMDDDRRLIPVFRTNDLTLLDLTRPVSIIRLASHPDSGDIVLCDLADKERYLRALAPPLMRVPGEDDIYAEDPAEGGAGIGIVNRTAVYGNRTGGALREAMDLVSSGAIPRDLVSPADKALGVWSGDLLRMDAERNGSLVVRMGIMRGSPLAGLLDAGEMELRREIRAVAASLRFRDDNLLVKLQFSPLAGTPLQTFLAHYPQGELDLLAHLPADSNIAFACRLPDFAPALPAAGQPVPLPSRALALLAGEAAIAVGRASGGTGYVHLAAKVRDAAGCSELLDQCALMLTGILASPQAQAVVPLQLKRSAVSYGGTEVRVWDFDVTGPWPIDFEHDAGARALVGLAGKDPKLYEFVRDDVLHLALGDAAFEQVKQIIDGTLDGVAGSGGFAMAADDMPNSSVIAGIVRVAGDATGLPRMDDATITFGAHVIGDGTLDVAVRAPHNAIANLVYVSKSAQAQARPAPGEPPPLHQPARDGNVPAVQRALAQGADVNATDDARRTPLHLAAEGGHGDVVEALLKAGADVNATDLQGRTPTGLAVQAGHDDVADLLRRHGGVE